MCVSDQTTRNLIIQSRSRRAVLIREIHDSFRDAASHQNRTAVLAQEIHEEIKNFYIRMAILGIVFPILIFLLWDDTVFFLIRNELRRQFDKFSFFGCCVFYGFNTLAFVEGLSFVWGKLVGFLRNCLVRNTAHPLFESVFE